MEKFINYRDTIEGSVVDCIVRWTEARGLKKHPVTQETLFLYVTDRNSEAVVVKESVPPEDKDLQEKTAHFHRNVGDTLIADSLSIFVKKKSAIHFNVEEGISHRHGAQIAHITHKTIAEIKTPLACLIKQINKEQKVLEIPLPRVIINE